MDNRVKVKNKNLYKMVTLKKTKKKDFQDQLSFNAGQKYCKMLQREHSAILCTFIKLPFVIKIFVLSIFDRFNCSWNINSLCVIYSYNPLKVANKHTCLSNCTDAQAGLNLCSLHTTKLDFLATWPML